MILPEPPLTLMPSLAVAIGLNEGLVLQQLYWLTTTQTVSQIGTPESEGWIKGGAGRWQRWFRWWSGDTIERIFASLQQKGLLEKRQEKAGVPCWWRLSSAALELIANPKTRLVDSPRYPPQLAVGTPRNLPLVPPATCGGLTACIRNNDLNDLNETTASAVDPAEITPTTQQLTDFTDTLATEATARAEADDTAQAYLDEVERLVRAGRVCTSQRNLASVASAVRKAWPDGVIPVAELRQALIDIRADQFWATQLLNMARWTRPGSWLGLLNEYHKRHVPLPRTTDRQGSDDYLRPLE